MFETLSPSGVVAAALIAPPGPEVIAALDQVGIDQLKPSAVADLLVAWERQAAYVALCSCTAVAATAKAVRSVENHRTADERDLAERAVRCEVAAAVRMSDSVADDRIMVGDALSGRLSMVAKALRSGDINYWHALAICDVTSGLTDEQAVWIARRVLPRARKQSMTQLRASLRRALALVTPDRTRKNAQTARTQHDVDYFRRDDGQAELRVVGDAADVLAIYATIQDAARKLGAIEKGSETPRSAGQLRVAALLALVTGTMSETADRAGGDGGAPSPTPYKVTVNVTMDLPTLLGLQDRPAELAGYGPLPASVARDLAMDGAWRRLLHDSVTGGLLDLGRRQYRPSAALARYIRARDRTCIFPLCNRRAETCDLDHAVPHRADGTGGETSRHNLHPLCPKHHRIKHETSWSLQTSDTELPVWISPLGRQYPVAQYDYRPPNDAGPSTFHVNPNHQTPNCTNHDRTNPRRSSAGRRTFLPGKRPAIQRTLMTVRSDKTFVELSAGVSGCRQRRDV